MVGAALAVSVVGQWRSSAPADLATEQATASTVARALARSESDVEIATERYDAALVALAQDRHMVALLDAQLHEEQARLGRLRTELRGQALHEFATAGGASTVAAVLAGSPSDAAIVQADVGVVASRELELEAAFEAASLQLAARRRALEATERQASQTLSAAQSAREAALADEAQLQHELAVVQGDLAALAQAQAAARAAVSQPVTSALATALPAQAPPVASGSALAQAAAIAEAIAARGDTGYLFGAAGQWYDGVQYFDCSGLVTYVYAQAGIELVHDAAGQYAASTPISAAELQPGDLVFYETLGASSIDHVAIYVGGGEVVEATTPGRPVSLDPIGWSGTPVAYGQP